MMTLRLELFVEHLEESIEFYHRALGFEPVAQREGGYTVLRRDAVQLDLQPQDHLSDGHPAKPGPRERVGLGIEIVLEVDDVEAAYRQVQTMDVELERPLGQRAWGLVDFRLLDPDGRYVRVTARR
jgi:catechol 2,3-dioxygenase-like lactoylglutathione lyase family enzyme